MAQRRVGIMMVLLLCGSVGLLAYAYREDLRQWSHADVEQLPHLHGLSLEQVRDELGRASRLMQVSPDGGLPGDAALARFRTEVMQAHADAQADGSKLQLKESRWHYSKHDVVVWFRQIKGQWLAVDSRRWKAGLN